jgi:hypothetical protein
LCPHLLSWVHRQPNEEQLVQQAQQKQQQQQLAAQAAQLLLNGNADGSGGGAVGDIDPQVVEQVIQVRTDWVLREQGIYRLVPLGDQPFFLQRWHCTSACSAVRLCL